MVDCHGVWPLVLCLFHWSARSAWTDHWSQTVQSPHTSSLLWDRRWRSCRRTCQAECRFHSQMCAANSHCWDTSTPHCKKKWPLVYWIPYTILKTIKLDMDTDLEVFVHNHLISFLSLLMRVRTFVLGGMPGLMMKQFPKLKAGKENPRPGVTPSPSRLIT